MVLGLEPPGDYFGVTLRPRMGFPVEGVLLAPLDAFGDEHPDVVIVRTTLANFGRIFGALGPSKFQEEYAGDFEASALRFFRGEVGATQAWAIRVLNRGLNWLNAFPAWFKLTRFLFRSTSLSFLLDKLLKRLGLADMSICRNSTVIPFLTGKANISAFCVGGIAWGKNRPEHFTSGFPWDIYAGISRELRY
ncbi:MAG: hypothetical protein ACTSU5_13375 [Promethearchaeota archaeon]